MRTRTVVVDLGRVSRDWCGWGGIGAGGEGLVRVGRDWERNEDESGVGIVPANLPRW